jgi:hypothetical protein
MAAYFAETLWEHECCTKYLKIAGKYVEKS